MSAATSALFAFSLNGQPARGEDVPRATTVGDAVSRLKNNGAYLTGDKHNHTTCSDGAVSPKVLVDQSVVAFKLDWFSQSGHGGGYPRDCRFSDPEYSSTTGTPDESRKRGLGEGRLWVDTIGAAAIKGDFSETSFTVHPSANGGRGVVQRMWRWQSIQDFNYAESWFAGRLAGKPVWQGLEWIVPGHEHNSMAILDEQDMGGIRPGNADAVAQFEYLFDRADSDFTGGKAAGFEDPGNRGEPKQPNVTGDHGKSVDGVEWLARHFPYTSYAVPAHAERQGAYLPTENRGYNVNHFRDYFNAGVINPGAHYMQQESLAFGFESEPGHQFANGGRGTYSAGRPTAGLWTYGGAGAYTAAEVTEPGKNFDGSALTDADITAINADITATAQFSSTINPTRPKARIVQSRVGVRTMWDALLAEGRKFFYFASSDWHNRGAFSPFEPQSTLDAWPGEYQKIYAYGEQTDGNLDHVAQAVLEGMRAGNTWSVQGDLIDQFYFVACTTEHPRCAVMGETLTIYEDEGGDIEFRIELRDPAGENFSPYEFNNASLAQIGMQVPTNQPVLDHIDVITGDITGRIAPTDPAYSTNVSNPTTRIFATFDSSNWTAGADGVKTMSWRVPLSAVHNSFYVRVRGTNMPQGTPNETDASGNPLGDHLADNVPCTATGAGTTTGFDPLACPAHLPTDANGVKYLDADVEAWTDLWFRANPIFVNYETE